MNFTLFDPKLDNAAAVGKKLFPAGNGIVAVLRLLVDFKTPEGIDRHMDSLAYVSYSTTTTELVKRMRSTLAPGCTLSAITSLDYGRIIYAAPGILEETIKEELKRTPPDLEEMAAAARAAFMTVEDIIEMEKEDTP